MLSTWAQLPSQAWSVHTMSHALTAARSGALRHALEQFTSSAASWQVVYVTRPDWPALAHSRAAHIAVLDASFNPPTRAHAALASLPRTSSEPFDGLLLIFSVRNADKGRGKAGDASPLERLEMMELLAYDLEAQHNANVAVALVDEPLVFNKSTLVHQHLHMGVPYHLHWLVGSDTITRVFHPRYYDSEAHLATCCHRFFGEEESYMLCAERASASVNGHAGMPGSNAVCAEASEAQALLHTPGPAHDWYERGKIELRTLSADDARHSSTAVRKFLQTKPSDASTHLAGMVPRNIANYLVSHCMYST